VEDSVRDYCREGNQLIYDVEKGEYQWIDTIADVSALKALHADAYSYEKEYEVGTWDDLIDRFLSCQTPKITICCYSGTRLIGSVIGFMYDSYNYIYSICVANEYQGKGIGSGLMRCFVNASQGKAIQLRVYSNNHMAWTMYEHFGFEFVELSALVGSTGSLL
jgi:ribosomal protein S18 acetylase RimI-like enzyme